MIFQKDRRETDAISLSGLKELPAIDFAAQKPLNDYIADLVFALYFNIDISNLGLKNAGQIRKKCQKNEFYKLLEK